MNHEKCEVYSCNDITMFPSFIKSSNLPHFEILGAPIGDYPYCANFISSKRQQATRLLSRLEGVARIDPQVALLRFRICAGFCKLVHLARTTPPRLHLSPCFFLMMMSGIAFLLVQLLTSLMRHGSRLSYA